MSVRYVRMKCNCPGEFHGYVQVEGLLMWFCRRIILASN
jgi:hypothetical protein